MRNKNLLSAAAITAIACFGAQSVQAQAPDELRACWVSRFNWARETKEETQDRIRDIMANLAESNFNAVLFQVRGECNTLYPSPYEPWGPQFNWTDPGWDPFQFAIDEARANNLEFHAYFNTHTMTTDIPPDDVTPQHRYHLHGPDAEDSWVIHNSDGEPVTTTDSYVWLSPGHPDASSWTRKVLMHIVDNYDIDGVHFDRIRTPTGDFSHDPRTVERFHGDGNPDGDDWGDFMRAQITRDLGRIYGDIARRNPAIKVSAAPFGIVKRVPGGYQGTGTESHYSWKQDTFGWMEQGVLDSIFPMIYWRIGSAHPFEVLLADFLDHSHGRHVYPGIHQGRDPIAQIYEARRQGAPGNTIWSYGSGDFSAYVAAPYSEPAAIPAMPWKEDPEKAIIVGTITTGDNDPVLDAWVWKRGNPQTYLTGADGFYSILKVTPGTHTLTVRKNGLGETVRTVTVKAGQVKEVDFTIEADVVGEAVRLTESGYTRLRADYIREVLADPAGDERVLNAYKAARETPSGTTVKELVRAIELKFIHDPSMSSLDLLEPELAEKYRNFDWQHHDYPGGQTGPNEDVSREMVDALREVFPERRANSGHDPVVVRAQATEEVWQYMEDEWVPIPGEEDYKLNRHAVVSYLEMREQAKKEGVTLIVRSAHRSRARAEAAAARANNPMAVASFSTHSLGLAIDFQMSHGDFSFSEITTRPMSEVVRMRESPVHKWMFLRGADFGWFPYMHEPWHWEYNPEGFRPTFWENFPDGMPPMPE
ncbi:MAG: family 10 glycosylhydrolase [Candidatus Sumerlaeia bacterium]|nr:family 10 glycosylhydrolase [Candidatus Sumerlaeia bacterium]